MFIQIEETPNPEALKFIPGREVSPKRVRNYTDKIQTIDSPLAEKLFDVKDIVGVYLGHDFITIIKDQKSNWQILKPEILSLIMECFTKNLPIITDENETDKKTYEGDEIVQEIIELIETRIRPAVANDGGDIIFHSFEDGIVRVELHGSCSGCPSSTITLKNGIENMLKYYVPEVESVEAV